jgi:hypothetical protein
VAATISPYVDQLLRAQNVAAGKLGTDVLRADKQTYNIDLTVLTLFGVVMKALNDHGVILDAEWQTRLNSALDGTWPDWIISQLPQP